MALLDRFKKNNDESIDEQKALEDEALQNSLDNEGSIPISKEHFWKEAINSVPPSIAIDEEYIKETSEINKKIHKFSDEEIRAALFRKANELDSLYTREVALSNISKNDKVIIRLAFTMAREILTYYEFASVDVQIYWFYEFADAGYALLSLSRGGNGFTVKEMATSRGYSEANINRRSRQSSDNGDVLGSIRDTFSNFFGGGGSI